MPFSLLLRESKPTDVSTFLFASYTTTKLRACVFPNFSPFLTALQANATKTSWRTSAMKCLVSNIGLHRVVCRLSYRLWSLAGRHVQRSATALSQVNRKIVCFHWWRTVHRSSEQLSLFVVVIATCYEWQTKVRLNIVALPRNWDRRSGQQKCDI
jgi:hypothetical protein